MCFHQNLHASAKSQHQVQGYGKGGQVYLKQIEKKSIITNFGRFLLFSPAESSYSRLPLLLLTACTHLYSEVVYTVLP